MPDTLGSRRLKAEGAEVVAGGTDVFVNMHGGKDRSGKVVDIKNIPTLQGHTFDEAQGLDLGALTTHREIELWDVIKKHYRAMFEGCSRVGSVQIRTRGTLGGNICNGAPSADSIGPMLVHDARVVAAGPAGEREIPLHNFYLGLKKLDLRPDELLVRIRIPAPPPTPAVFTSVHSPGRHGSGAAGRLYLCGADRRHPENCADRPDYRRTHAYSGL
ncbi:MAG: FAD binding domain-containing protein [Dysosmobacter welbionis]